MAIASGIPGLKVTVEAADTALPEYDYAEHDAVDHGLFQTAVSRYIEAPRGAEFAIRTLYKESFDPPLPIQMDIMLDGTYIQAPFQATGGRDTYDGHRYGQATFVNDGRSVTQKFRFADLEIDENDKPITPEAKRHISQIGQIVLYFYYVERLESVTPADIPPLTSHESAAISQKALKEKVALGDSLTCQTSLSAPEACPHVHYHQVKTSESSPFASFTFYYRSTAALKSLGIFARTPSPSPPASPTPEPELRDPDTMTAEELRAELVRMRTEQQQNATHIKRERERDDSEETVVGDTVDDGEVEWLGTQPKKLRRSPREGDEVVDLGE